jgi:hypothetical protein
MRNATTTTEFARVLSLGGSVHCMDAILPIKTAVMHMRLEDMNHKLKTKHTTINHVKYLETITKTTMRDT